MRILFSPDRESIPSTAQPEDPLVPPPHLAEGVGGAYAGVGKHFFGHFTGIGGLKPGDRVLDVGCGCGRMAVPMMPFLAGSGDYHGFDIVPEGIEWCQKNISPRNPRFHFELADIYNKHYNPQGRHQAGEYRFPYESDSFDFTILTSVFTHMLAPDMKNYLAEIVRTLKPGGRCMITYFLLNQESREWMAKGKSKFAFKHSLPDCFTSNDKTPEVAIAYEEGFVRDSFAKGGLHILEPIYYGAWSGRERILSFQDVILAVKN